MGEARSPPPGWASLRQDVLSRDDYTCQNCGIQGGDGDVELHAHHQIPKAEGGPDTVDNLVTLCSSCHRELHAERRRKGSFAEILEIFEHARYPVFTISMVDRKLSSSRGRTRNKLKQLAEEGALQRARTRKLDIMIYYLPPISPDQVEFSADQDMFVDGVKVDGRRVAYDVTPEDVLGELSPDEAVTAWELAHDLDLPERLVSRYFEELSEAGKIQKQQHGFHSAVWIRERS